MSSEDHFDLYADVVDDTTLNNDISTMPSVPGLSRIVPPTTTATSSLQPSSMFGIPHTYYQQQHQHQHVLPPVEETQYQQAPMTWSGPLDTNATKCIIISGLHWYTTDVFMENLLNQYGKIVRCDFMEEKTNGKSKGMLCCEFATLEAACKAKNNLNGAQIQGTTITADYLPQYPSSRFGIGNENAPNVAVGGEGATTGHSRGGGASGGGGGGRGTGHRGGTKGGRQRFQQQQQQQESSPDSYHSQHRHDQQQGNEEYTVEKNEHNKRIRASSDDRDRKYINGEEEDHHAHHYHHVSKYRRSSERDSDDRHSSGRSSRRRSHERSTSDSRSRY
jgi:cold-inducible RNA-binding protein